MHNVMRRLFIGFVIPVSSLGYIALSGRGLAISLHNSKDTDIDLKFNVVHDDESMILSQ